MDQIPVLYRSSEILAKASSLKEEVIAWRRDFHQNPELGFEEVRTSERVARHLEGLGLEVRRNVGRTGVVGLLRGRQPGPTIGLRADMDALPIQDQKQAAYRSTVPGKMHACGHDAHTSILMGAAQFLSQQERPEKGNIAFVFQPAEEGLGGASEMIKDGLLTAYDIEAMAGLHVFPGLPTGHISCVRNVSCAAADRIRINIIGRGGHAAHPHQAIDSVAVTAEVLSALQHIASRQVNPLDPIVITIGKIQGGSASNVIAPEVELLGTVRTLNPALREQMPSKIEAVINGVTMALGASYEFDYHFGYPSIVNDDQMVDRLLATSDQVLGEGKYQMVAPSMGDEDFSYYTEHVPGVFFRLGVGNPEKSTQYPLHHPMFDIDEDALPVGIAMLSALALNYLNQ